MLDNEKVQSVKRGNPFEHWKIAKKVFFHDSKLYTILVKPREKIQMVL